MECMLSLYTMKLLIKFKKGLLFLIDLQVISVLYTNGFEYSVPPGNACAVFFLFMFFVRLFCSCFWFWSYLLSLSPPPSPLRSPPPSPLSLSLSLSSLLHSVCVFHFLNQHHTVFFLLYHQWLSVFTHTRLKFISRSATQDMMVDGQNLSRGPFVYPENVSMMM